MFKPAKYLLLFVGFLIATGCVQTSVLTREGESFTTDDEHKVLLMPLDIELYEMTGGGMLAPKADWTALATEHVAEAIKRQLKTHRDTMILYKEPAEGSGAFKEHQQLIKLHEVVGASIMSQYSEVWSLPTKAGRFEWTLGQGTKQLQEEFGAHYGLFVFMRDSYASAERVALMLGAAVLGVGIPLGQQIGFASLVDLRSGNIVWFNQLFSESGDLRELKLAQDSVRNLLADFPL